MPTNDERKATKIRQKIQDQHAWRIQVWASTQIRLNVMNDQLLALGQEPETPYDPDFTDGSTLAYYANPR